MIAKVYVHAGDVGPFAHVTLSLQREEFGPMVKVEWQRNRLSLREAWEVEAERAGYVRELDVRGCYGKPYGGTLTMRDNYSGLSWLAKVVRMLAANEHEGLSYANAMQALKRAKVQVAFIYFEHGRDLSPTPDDFGRARAYLDGVHCTRLLADAMVAEAERRAAA